MNNDGFGSFWETIKRDGKSSEARSWSWSWRPTSWRWSRSAAPSIASATTARPATIEARGDGKGGLLARGYYARCDEDREHLCGPYRTRNRAFEAGVRQAIRVRARDRHAKVNQDLLEALERAVGYMSPGPDLDAARAAIARAKGEDHEGEGPGRSIGA